MLGLDKAFKIIRWGKTAEVILLGQSKVDNNDTVVINVLPSDIDNEKYYVEMMAFLWSITQHQNYQAYIQKNWMVKFLKYAAGNGLLIYDVSDPDNVELLSVFPGVSVKRYTL